MAGRNKMRAINRLPYDFVDGLLLGGVDVTNLNQLNSSAGASMVGYEGGTVRDALNRSKPLYDYAALRAYTGSATHVHVQAEGIEGFFYQDVTDTGSADNGGTVIVSSNSKRWKRHFDGAVNVKWFGAKGNGIVDSTLAFKAAVGTGQKRVYVPAGNWLLTDLQLPSDVDLIGDGVDVTVIKRNGTNFTSPFFSCVSKNDVTVSNITFDGSKSAGFSGVPYELYFLDCARIRCRNIKIINASGRGLSFDNNTDASSGSYSLFDSVYVDSSNECGMVIQESSNVVVDSCGWSNNGTYGLLYVSNGLPYRGDNITVNNSISINNGASGIFFPLVGTSVNPACRNVTITGNLVSDNGENGIAMQSQYGVVSGNSCFRNGTTMAHQGILINGTDITVANNSSSDNTGVGIDLGDCLRTVCDGNTVTNNGIIGIEVNSCEGTVVSNNMVSGNNTTADAGYFAAGILVHKGTGGYPFVGNAIDTILTGNIVRIGPQQRFGILVTADCTDTVVTSNICKSAGTILEICLTSTTVTESHNVTATVKPGTISFIASATSTLIPDVGTFFQLTGAATVDSITQAGLAFHAGRVIRVRFNNAGITLRHGVGNIYLNNGTDVLSTSSAQSVELLCVGEAWLETSRSF